MTKSDWMDLTVLERKKYNCLSEVMDLSRQLSEVLDRNDGVSARMLVAMREEPLLQLKELKEAVTFKRESLTAEEREWVSALAEGAAPRNEDETVYQNQAGSVRRLLERVIELDERLSRRLAGENSFYAQKR